METNFFHDVFHNLSRDFALVVVVLVFVVVPVAAVIGSVWLRW